MALVIRRNYLLLDCWSDVLLQDYACSKSYNILIKVNENMRQRFKSSIIWDSDFTAVNTNTLLNNLHQLFWSTPGPSLTQNLFQIKSLFS